MYSDGSKKEVFASIDEAVALHRDGLCAQIDIVNDLGNQNPEYFKDDVKRISDIVSSVMPADLNVPRASVRVTMTGTVATITLCNKYTDKTMEFKSKFTVVYREDMTREELIDLLLEKITGIYKGLANECMIRENLEVINGVLADILNRAGVDYSVKLTSVVDGSPDRKIDYISDSEVVFIVDKQQIFNLANIAICKEPNNYFSEDDVEAAKEAVANQFATAHNTLELVANKGFAVISYLCGLKKGVKPFSYIKKVTGRKCQSVHSDGLVYYQDGDVYSIISISEEGNDVVLSPFNIKTLEKVEGVDVLAQVAERK